MSLFSSAVDLIKRKVKRQDTEVLSPETELDFDTRNYVKESFSVMIVQPVSSYLMKAFRVTSFVITGGLIGLIASIVLFCIFIQFRSVESKFISLFLDDHIMKMFPDADFSTKSTKLSWNAEMNSPEISIKRLQLDDVVIPSISIFPNVMETIKSQKLITNGISIINPKINIRLSEDFKTVHFDPNMEKANTKTSLYEPLFVLSSLKKLVNDDVNVKILNADVSVEENGYIWNMKNVFCHYTGGNKFPKACSFKIKLPGQDYFSNFNVIRASVRGEDKYVVNMNSFNPYSFGQALAKRSSPVNSPIINSLLQNNIPVSGSVRFRLKKGKVLDGDFDLAGSGGSIKLPVKNILSPNLGKAVDSASIIGTFTENSIDISSLNVAYGDSGIQLTNVSVPMVEYHLMDIANLSGTLSLSNINIAELNTLLPENFSKSISPFFKNYLPGFKLDLFKLDLNGGVSFGKRNIEEPMRFSNGLFKVRDAQISFGDSLVQGIEATGKIGIDGVNIKLHKALFDKVKIIGGDFYVDSKDNSWIGTATANLSFADISKYAADISKKFQQLPMDKLHIAKNVNVNLKLVKVAGDTLDNVKLPFRIVEGNGILKSVDNTKELKFSWNANELLISGEACEGKEEVFILLEENLKKHEGRAEYHFKSTSDFLTALIPNISKFCSGDYSADIKARWGANDNYYDVNIDLKDALMNLPVLGDIKLRGTEGSLSAKIHETNGVWDISNLDLNTANNKLKGHIVVDNEGYLQKCILNDMVMNGNSVKINLLRDVRGKLSTSIIGSQLNSDILLNLFKATPNNEVVAGYINVDKLFLTPDHVVNNVKGSFDIQNGKLVNGGCYGVIAENTTLALTAQPQAGEQANSLVSLSASDAGQFLKFFKITDSVEGGTINIVMKDRIISDTAVSGAFEITDFMAKHNQLSRLVSFSSMNYINGAGDQAIGFNSCFGSFVWSDNMITIENGKAVGPSIGISYSGHYDRLSDQFNISGMSMLTTSALNMSTLRGAHAAPYYITGSFGRPNLTIKPLTFFSADVIFETFGNMLPMIPTVANDYVESTQVQDSGSIPDAGKDPFGKGAFDQAIAPAVNEQPKPAIKVTDVTENKFGVKINRKKTR